MQDELNIKLLPAITHLLQTAKIDVAIAILSGVLFYFLSYGLEKEYSSSIELVSSEEVNPQEEGLGSLLSLQGLTSSQNKTTKPLRILTSTPFLIDFIDTYKLNLSILSEDYNSAILDENSSISSLREEDNQASPKNYKSLASAIASKIEIVDRSPFIIISVNTNSPILSKILVEELVKFLNRRMKEKAIKESKLEIDYLTKEMLSIKISDIKNVFSKVIEQSITSSSLANMKEDYIFEVIEPASINNNPTSPNRQIIFMIATFLTFISILLFRLLSYIRTIL